MIVPNGSLATKLQPLEVGQISENPGYLGKTLVEIHGTEPEVVPECKISEKPQKVFLI